VAELVAVVAADFVLASTATATAATSPRAVASPVISAAASTETKSKLFGTKRNVIWKQSR